MGLFSCFNDNSVTRPILHDGSYKNFTLFINYNTKKKTHRNIQKECIEDGCEWVRVGVQYYQGETMGPKSFLFSFFHLAIHPSTHLSTVHFFNIY